MRRPALLCALIPALGLLGLGAAQAQPAAGAQPSGGTVAAGSATIAQTANTTTITQGSQRASINWQSFDIGSQQTVLFHQPSSSAVALNRVAGPNPSQIAGRLTANGQIIISNLSGVIFYHGAQVNTAGLMVTAAGISDANFMAGRMVFDQPANPGAAVINQGHITVRQAGLAALVAPQVANSGVITARLGHVVLAGAETATLDLYGDGLMAIDVTGAVAQAPNGAAALVTNTGLVRADGGTVQLTARAADGIVQNLVDSGGRIQADSARGHAGTVVLSGIGGNITVSGQLSATGTMPGTAGGNIAVNGSGTVTVAAGADIDASGQAGGGTIAIGTTLARAAGGPTTPSRHTAADVIVASGATIAASATGRGNGGRVTVLASHATVMDGTIKATGGPRGGNGGFVETSAPSLVIGNNALVDASAPAGAPGTWLLDPLDLDVVSSGGSTNVTQGGSPFTVTPSGTGAQIGNAIIDDELDRGVNVVLTTEGTIGPNAGNITVDTGAPITWGSGATLTMNASGGIIIDAAITGTTNISVGAATLSLNALGAGGITQDAVNGAISVGNLAVSSVGPATLGAANAVGTLAATVTGTGNSFAFRDDSTALTIGGVSVAGGPTINGVTTAGGQIYLATTTTGGITANAAITSNGGSIAIVTAPGATFTNDAAISSTGTGGGGTIMLLGDDLALSGGGGTIDAGTGTVLLGPTTTGQNIVLGAASTAGSLGLQNADFASITAGMVQVGYRAVGGQAAVTGNISIGGSAGVNLSTTNFSSLLLVTGNTGTISQTEPISFVGGTLGAIGDANISFDQGNSVGRFAGFTDGGLLGYDDGVALTIGSLTQATLGVSVPANGFASALAIPSGGGLPSNPLSGVTASGSLTLGGTGGLTIAANVTAPGQTVTLGASNGTLTQTGGTITAGTLTGGATNGIALNGSNAISIVNALASANGALSVNDTANLTITGTVSGKTGTTVTTTGTLTVSGSAITTGSGGTVSLTGSSITAGGVISDGGSGTTTLTASNGTISETGTLIAGTLGGSATGAANLSGATQFSNQINTLAGFSASSLTLTDSTALTIAGPVTANFLNISAFGRMVLAGNIATLGAPLSQQSGTTPAAQGSTLQVFAPEQESGGGASFVQTGTVNLTDPPATTLRVQLPASGGTASFNNLVGTGANLVLALGSGTATGAMQVGGLLVIGSGGSSTLTGSVAGLATSAAAAAGQISPAVNASYTFNGCPIGSPACGGLPPSSPLPVAPTPIVTASSSPQPDTATLGGLLLFLAGPRLPPVPPLPGLDITALPLPPLLANQLAPQDVVPPNISFEDY